MTPEQRKEFHESWTAKLFEGGWICASWPPEYGGKGLSLLEQVVLNEEFAGPALPCVPTSSATPWSAPPSCSGDRGTEEEFIPAS